MRDLPLCFSCSFDVVVVVFLLVCCFVFRFKLRENHLVIPLPANDETLNLWHFDQKMPKNALKTFKYFVFVYGLNRK